MYRASRLLGRRRDGYVDLYMVAQRIGFEVSVPDAVVVLRHLRPDELRPDVLVGERQLRDEQCISFERVGPICGQSPELFVEVLRLERPSLPEYAPAICARGDPSRRIELRAQVVRRQGRVV